MKESIKCYLHINKQTSEKLNKIQIKVKEDDDNDDDDDDDDDDDNDDVN